MNRCIAVLKRFNGCWRVAHLPSLLLESHCCLIYHTIIYYQHYHGRDQRGLRPYRRPPKNLERIECTTRQEKRDSSHSFGMTGSESPKELYGKAARFGKAAATNANSRITNRVTPGLSLPRSSITFTATDASGYLFNVLRHGYLRPSQRTASSKSLSWSLLVKILSPWPMFM
jgi:hypothetical protein